MAKAIRLQLIARLGRYVTSDGARLKCHCIGYKTQAKVIKFTSRDKVCPMFLIAEGDLNK